MQLRIQDRVGGRRRLFNNLGRKRIFVLSAARKDWEWGEVDEGHKYHLRKIKRRGPKKDSSKYSVFLLSSVMSRMKLILRFICKNVKIIQGRGWDGYNNRAKDLIPN